MGRILRKSGLLLFAIMAVGLLWTSDVHAGNNADGNPGDYNYEDEGAHALTATTVVMQDGGTYDVSKYSGATYLSCNKSGTYILTGDTIRTMLVIESHPGDTIIIYLKGVFMNATWHCPGAAGNARSAVEIKGTGGTVKLISLEGTKNYFEGKGGYNAIRKDTTDVELIFDGAGEITAKADTSGIKTCGIGCYTKNTFGNVEFKGGTINAYGSTGTGGGGAAIGADMYAKVNGITFSGAKVNAYAGSASAACIGTCSAYLFNPVTDVDRAPTDCKNIYIKGGVIECHAKDMDSMGLIYGGAGIGGGWGNSADGIYISGGTVYAYGTEGAAGIGGGCEGDGWNIEISGGTVYAQGMCSGIGAGDASGPVSEKDNVRFGDTTVKITGGNVTAIGGLSADKQKGAGCGIGGGKEKYYEYSSRIISSKSHVEITGGTVKAYGRHCAAIGASANGYMEYVSIGGGDVYAETDTTSACIGSCKSGLESNCHKVYITGGTVEAVEKDGDNKSIGTIGGQNSENVMREGNTNVYISGGNLKATVKKGTPHISETDDTVVECKEVAIGTFGIGCSRSQKHPLAAIETVKGRGASYGLNDTKIFGTDVDRQTAIYIWLPSDDQVTAVTTGDVLFNYGPAKEDEKTFKNLRPDSLSSTTVYPKFWFFFDDNANIRDTSKDCAWAYIGEARVSDLKKATSGGVAAAGYYADKNRAKVLLTGEGNLLAEVEAPSTYGSNTVQWTDQYCNLILKYKNSTEDPKDSQGYGIWGIPLYSYYEEFTIKYEIVAPENASTRATATGGGEKTGVVWSDTGEVALGKDTDGNDIVASLKGYKHDKWAVNKDGSGTTFPNAAVNIKDLNPDKKGEITLYSTWIAHDYTVNFQGNGADPGSSMASQVFYFDQPADLKQNTYTKNNNKFIGWRSAYSVGSPTYCDKDKVVNLCNLNGDEPVGITLNALWAPDDEVIVSIFNDCVAIEDAAVKLKQGTQEIPLTPEMTATTGWYKATGVEQGTYTVIAEGPGGTTYLSEEENKTVTVTTGENVFVIQLVTVSANDEDNITNGSTKIKDPRDNEWKTSVQYVPERTELEIKTEKSGIKKGYTFDGYSYAGVAPTWDSEKKDQTITVNGQVTITGHATPAVYHVTFDPNGGEGSKITQDYVYNEQQKLFPNTFSRKGYTFVNWNTKADGTGKSFENNEEVVNLSDKEEATITLFAQWKAIEYFIGVNNAKGHIIGSNYTAFYAANGGEGFYNPDVGEILRKYTVEDEVVISNPTWTDYDFMGWTGTNLSEPTTTLVIPKGTTGNMEFDAHWRLKQYHVSFDTDGGSQITEEVVWIHDKAVQPADPEKNGATFLGWYADAGKTTEYNFDEEVTSDRTIYAKWKEGVPKSGDTGTLILWITLAAGALGLAGLQWRKGQIDRRIRRRQNNG